MSVGRWIPYLLGGAMLVFTVACFFLTVRAIAWAQMQCGQLDLTGCDEEFSGAFREFHLIAAVVLAFLLPFKKRWCRLTVVALASIDLAVGSLSFLGGDKPGGNAFYWTTEAIAVEALIFMLLGLIIVFGSLSVVRPNRLES